MSQADEGAAPRPFTFRVPDEDIADLHRRLAATRWPDEVNDGAWGWGVPLETMQALCAYWRDRFDWRAAEARLFALPNFLIGIDGLDTHFIHARSPHADATPLIMTHGWPGAVFEFLAVIPRLTLFTSWCRHCPAMGFRRRRGSPACPSARRRGGMRG